MPGGFSTPMGKDAERRDTGLADGVQDGIAWPCHVHKEHIPGGPRRRPKEAVHMGDHIGQAARQGQALQVAADIPAALSREREVHNRHYRK